MESKRLYRVAEKKVVAGVCTGLGKYFNLDPVVVRLAWILFACLWGSGLVAYLIAWIIVPEQPKIDGGHVNYEQ